MSSLKTIIKTVPDVGSNNKNEISTISKKVSREKLSITNNRAKAETNNSDTVESQAGSCGWIPQIVHTTCYDTITLRRVMNASDAPLKETQLQNGWPYSHGKQSATDPSMVTAITSTPTANLSFVGGISDEENISQPAHEQLMHRSEYSGIKQF